MIDLASIRRYPDVLAKLHPTVLVLPLSYLDDGPLELRERLEDIRDRSAERSCPERRQIIRDEMLGPRSLRSVAGRPGRRRGRKGCGV